jgi:hypothetical protein
MNVRDDGQDKTLADEPGIPELVELYYDDNYDYETGKFTGMTDKTKKIFESDLKIFYNVFTGNKTMTPEITKFSDIKLRDYHKMPLCEGSNAKFKQKYKGPANNKLFKDYAENLKDMISKANKNQNALLTIINQLFVYTIDPQTGKKQIRVVPTLSEERLQELVVETRALIIKLYLTCEIDYVNSLKIYEAIIEKKIFETAQNQLNKLNEMEEELLTEEKVPESANVKEIHDIAEEKLKEVAENAKEEKAVVEQKIEETKKVLEEEPSNNLEPSNTNNLEPSNTNNLEPSNTNNLEPSNTNNLENSKYINNIPVKNIATRMLVDNIVK